VTATWNIPRSHLTTTDRYSLPLSTVYGRIVLTAVLTPPPSPTSTRSILRILHTTGRRPYLEPSAVPVGDGSPGALHDPFSSDRSLNTWVIVDASPCLSSGGAWWLQKLHAPGTEHPGVWTSFGPTTDLESSRCCDLLLFCPTAPLVRIMRAS
jgi:hypothetical protein